MGLEVRKKKEMEYLSEEMDAPVIRFSKDELEERAFKAEKAITEGRIYSITEVRNKLGL